MLGPMHSSSAVMLLSAGRAEHLIQVTSPRA